jgi:hypothetical protein
MSVQGKVKEFSKKTGFAEYDVIAINPDREQLSKLLGQEIEKDIEYIGEDENGVKKAIVVFWLKDVKPEGQIRNVRFFLKDKEKENKDQTKKQYINEVGVCSWSDDPNNLPEWFVKREFRVAHDGEEELYNFITCWIHKLDTRDAATILQFDFKKLINGNVKELASEIKGEYSGTITCLSTVRTTEKDDGIKEYEQIYNRNFLPGYVMRHIRTKKIDGDFIEVTKGLEKKKRSRLQKFILDVIDSQYGCKDFYTLGELEEYDPNKNMAAGNKVIDQTDASY